MSVGFFDKFHLNEQTILMTSRLNIWPNKKILFLVMKAAGNWFLIEMIKFSQEVWEQLIIIERNTVADTNNLFTSIYLPVK